MQIGYVSSDVPGEIDRVLTEVAAAAAREGIALAGTIQPPELSDGQGKCHIVLRLLPDGPVRNVSVDLGPDVTGCRLDPGALEEAMLIANERVGGAQALIVNKFGKQEAVGRGLVTAIGMAAGRGLPVLAGVAPEWLDAFRAFTGGHATPLPADAEQALAWLHAALAAAAA